MNPDVILRAVLKIMPQLPQLFGAEAWADFAVELDAQLSRLRATTDTAFQASIVANIMLLFRKDPQAASLLRAAIQQESAGTMTERRGSSEGAKLGPTASGSAIFPLVTALRQSLTKSAEAKERFPASPAEPEPAPPARYVNLWFSRGDDQSIVQKTTTLRASQEYALWLNIGPLSEYSVVANAKQNPFPPLPLLPTQAGHWLEVIVVSDEFQVEPHRYAFFLPRVGSSWVCSCPPGSEHACTPETRQPFLIIPLAAPKRAGRGHLRIGIYYQKNLVQSQLLTAEVTDAEQGGTGYGSWIDYSLTDLSDVSFLPPRKLNILTNDNSDGNHRIIINGDSDDVLTFRLTEGQVRAAIDMMRELLRQIFFAQENSLFGRSEPRLLLDKNNAKSREAFIGDIARLAPIGWKLWVMLFEGEEMWWNKLREPITIQVARTDSSSLIFPSALVYDLPLESGRATPPCPVMDHWGDFVTLLATDPPVRRCPFESRHADNTLCPFGFWGFKHIIEQPPAMPKNRNLPLAVRIANRPISLVVGRSLDLDMTISNAHLAAMRQVTQFGLRDCTSRDDLATKLSDEVEVVYFYCHGRRNALPGTSETTPCLEVGKGEQLEPSDIVAWRLRRWPSQHWQETSPLVFINGCHTAELTPEALLSFVETFAKAYAAGVIGTEITLEQRFASEAAEQFFVAFQCPGATVGQALQRMRLHFLAKGNLLGLVYTAYCSAELKLAERT